MSDTSTKAPATNTTNLTIEYLDAQGQVQRTEQLQGSQFTLRVHAGQEHVIADMRTLAKNTADHEEAHETSPAPLSASSWGLPAFVNRFSAMSWALILLGIYGLLTAWQAWLTYNPDEDSRNYVAMALGLLGGVALWSAFWALLGKIIAKHARFWQHACCVLLAGVVVSLLLLVLHRLSFMLGWFALGRMDRLLLIFTICLLVWAHLSLIVPARRLGQLRLFMAVFTASSISLMMWTNHKNQDTVLDTLHSPHLFSNAWQLHKPQSASGFFEQAAKLESRIKEKAAITEPGEEGFEGGAE
jgi:hypothetical protein